MTTFGPGGPGAGTTGGSDGSAPGGVNSGSVYPDGSGAPGSGTTTGRARPGRDEPATGTGTIDRRIIDPEAAGAVREATDLTNELLAANARNLREANAKVRTEMERGVFDIQTVRMANAELIATIEDSLRIADEGKARRAAAEAELTQMEADLKASLAASKARRDLPARQP